ncbi:uncharacterized protein LOC109722289 isoform X1 [Ananas comosus]|uniref:Uncharacterized protein LOC109722289 isoform X1 n=1 Tax=Ananas comosus TaxID=4615 RepID=A0A6P5GIE9_ANACO|nr:uncharacterized protein LOC109722289 isoform X1 [Ananas comosus]
MHAKSKMSGMLSKGFKPDKCKTSLRLAVARLKLLRNKREVQIKQMRRELAQLLETGQDQTARIRVEHVIREEKTMSAYDLISVYCELIMARMPMIESQKNCPIDLKEAIASIVFASPRCADVPELMDIRKHFSAKYGKEFVTAALEVRPQCGVSHLVVEKLSARAPDIETKLKILTAVAEEHNVKWEPKVIEEQIQQPIDDRLDGPTTFISANVHFGQSFDLKPPSALPKDEPIKRMSEHETSVPLSSQSYSETSDMEPKGVTEEVEPPHSKENKASFNKTNWKIEFKDAASAAQAAAESAERASFAARAAAELARQNSAESKSSNNSFKYRPSKGQVEDIDKQSVHSPDRSSSDRMRTYPQASQTSLNKEAKSTSVDSSSMDTTSRRLSPSPSHSSVSSMEDDHDELRNTIEKTDVRTYDNSEKRFSEMEFTVNDHKKGNNNTNNYSKSLSSGNDTSTIYKETIWDEHFDNTTFADSSTAVFDRYGSDTEDPMVFGNKSRDNSLRKREESSKFGENSIFSPNNIWGSKEQKSGHWGSGSPFSPPVSGPYLEDKAKEMKTNSTPPRLDDDLPPSFDSDGFSSDNEDEIHESMLHKQSVLRKDSYLGVSGHSGDHQEDKEDKRSSPSFVSDVKETKKEAESSIADTYGKTSSLTRPNDEQSYRNDKLLSNLDDTELWQSSEVLSMEERGAKKQLPSTSKHPEIADNDYESEKGLDLGKLTGGLKNRGYQHAPYTRKPMQDMSVPSKQSSDEAFKNIEESYEEGSSLESSQTYFGPDSREKLLPTSRRNYRERASTPIKETPDISPTAWKSSTKSFLSAADSGHELHDSKPGQTESKESKSRRPVNYFDFGGNEVEDLEPVQDIGRRGSGDIKLSRRTKGTTSEGTKGGISKTHTEPSKEINKQVESTRRKWRNREPFPGATPEKILDGEEISMRSDLLIQQPSTKPLESASPSFKEASKSSALGSNQARLVEDENDATTATITAGSASAEASSTSSSASHIHPKLPDYDSFAAHFRLLRSNRQ